MNKYILYIFIFLISNLCLAQEEQTSEISKSKHSLGLQMGTTSGFGFSYRYIPKKFGVQVVGIAGSITEDFVSSTGVSLLYRFHESRRIDVFGFFSGHLFYLRYDKLGSEWMNSGVGAGINYKFREHFSLNYQLGYAIFNLTGNTDFSQGPMSAVAAEIGFHYNF